MIATLFDTETSGLIKSRLVQLNKQPHVIEFYGCRANLDDGTILAELDQLIKPPIEIDEKITKITTITNELLSDQPPFVERAGEIKSFLESSDVLIAHNAKFDQEMIEIELERIGMTITWPKTICTIEATMELRGYRLNLGELHKELFGEKFTGAHRANADVKALLRCCLELKKRSLL